MFLYVSHFYFRHTKVDEWLTVKIFSICLISSDVEKFYCFIKTLDIIWIICKIALLLSLFTFLCLKSTHSSVGALSSVTPVLFLTVLKKNTVTTNCFFLDCWVNPTSKTTSKRKNLLWRRNLCYDCWKLAGVRDKSCSKWLDERSPSTDQAEILFSNYWERFIVGRNAHKCKKK